MKKTILILVLLLLSTNIMYVFAEEDKGIIDFEITLPASVDQDIFITLKNLDNQNIYNLSLLRVSDFKAEKELHYGNYQVINVEMEGSDKYEIGYGGAFEIDPKGFVLEMYIKEKKIPSTITEPKPSDNTDTDKEIPGLKDPVSTEKPVQVPDSDVKTDIDAITDSTDTSIDPILVIDTGTDIDTGTEKETEHKPVMDPGLDPILVEEEIKEDNIERTGLTKAIYIFKWIILLILVLCLLRLAYIFIRDL